MDASKDRWSEPVPMQISADGTMYRCANGRAINFGFTKDILEFLVMSANGKYPLDPVGAPING